jgi:hypothetical protein
MANPAWNPDAKDQTTFGLAGRVITPSANLLDPPAKAVVMLADGDITIVPLNSTQAISFVGVPAGYIPPFVVGKVTACSVSCAAID